MSDMKAAHKAIADRMAQGLPGVKTPGEKLKDNPRSMRAAINAKCWECQGGDYVDSGWKWAIGNCLCEECPLITFRPYQKKFGQPPEGVYRLSED